MAWWRGRPSVRRKKVPVIFRSQTNGPGKLKEARHPAHSWTPAEMGPNNRSKDCGRHGKRLFGAHWTVHGSCTIREAGNLVLLAISDLSTLV